MAVNGSVQALTPAEKAQLVGPAIAGPFDPFDRLFASFDEGKVFHYGVADARQVKQMLREDGNARKVEQVLTLPLRAAPWEIRTAPDGDVEYQYIRDQFDNKLDRVIDQVATAVVFRRAFFELTFGLEGEQVTVEAIDYRPPATCEAAFNPKTGEPVGFRQLVGNPGGLMQLKATPGGQPGYVTIEPDRAFVFTHGGYREPIEGISDLDVAYWCWQTRQKVYFLWFQFLEQQSLPKTIVYGQDQPEADRNAAAFAKGKASAVIGMPRPNEPGARGAEVIESSGQGAAQFLEAINYLDGQMSASVLAGFTDLAALATGSRGQGSYALSADQSEFFLAARQAVADEIAEAISCDLFKKLCVMQFGADCRPPTLEIGPLSKHDKERAAAMLNALIVAPQFNVPPGLVDLLITSTAGFLGLPVDQVAQLVADHPVEDPAARAAKAGLIASGSLNPDGTPIDPTTVAPVVAPDPAAAALAHTVDVLHTLVAADPRAVKTTAHAAVKTPNRGRTRRRKG